MKLAQIENSIVINVAEVDADAVPEFMAGWPEVVEGGGGIGWGWGGGGQGFTPPDPQPQPVPAVISRFQARAALMDAGLLADVELAVGSAGPLVQLAWAEAVEWRRDSPTIAAIAASLDLTDGQLDDLFRAAALIAV